MVGKCNKMIENENKLYTDLKQLAIRNNEASHKIKTLKLSAKSCLSIITSYNEILCDTFY